jgi:AcrR family transcriptional regulator
MAARVRGPPPWASRPADPAGASRLFAAHGPDAVTIRPIATAASLSPALVVHHFGPKEGLREAVAQRVPALFKVSVST